jgi:membrane associated rhomboid family serine protease
MPDDVFEGGPGPDAGHAATPRDAFAQDRPETLPPGGEWVDPVFEVRRRMAEFHSGLRLQTPRVLVTPALIGLNVAVFIAMTASGVSPANPNLQDMLKWGADYGPRTLHGEWWRMLTCTFLHFGFLHLLFNMYALAVAGPLVERLLGNVGFLVMYLVSGLLGSAASLAWHPTVIGAGASGAVFGVFGALLGFVLRRRDTIPGEVLRQLRNSTIAFLVYNLAFGLAVPAIDLAAHGGGFVAGLLCGLVQSRPLGGSAAGRAVRNLVVAGGGLVLTVLVVGVWGEDVPDPEDAWHRAMEIQAKDTQRVNEVGQQVVQRKATEEDMVRVLDEVLPEWSQARERLQQLRGLPGETRQRVARLAEYMEAREEGWRLLAAGIREHDPQKQALAEEKLQTANRLVQELNESERRR